MSWIPNVEDVQTHDEPVNRLTRLCESMIQAMRMHPEFSGDVKAIIMLEDDEDGGIAVDGYDTNNDAIETIFVHLKALAEVTGHRMEVEFHASSEN